MTWLSLPWTELTITVPLVGAVVVATMARDRDAASRWCLGFALVTLLCSALPWIALSVDGGEGRWDPFFASLGRPLFAVDGLSAPLLPLVALLHGLTALSTPRAEASRSSFAFLLVGESIRLATFACSDPWPLAVLLCLGGVPPLAELILQKKPWRVFALHGALFAGLLFVGVAGLDAARGPASALMLAVLVRAGTVPFHLWTGDLFEHAPFGSALLFVAPLAAVYAVVRLILPVAPEWVLQTVGWASLVTAVYTAGMAAVQRDARRMLAYLFLSQASLVMVGLELHTAVSLTGALCLWVSVALSLGGVGLTLRALEARFGRLSLTTHHGLYPQSPALAVCFLLTGLTSVGFPGTLGFVAAELLADGVVEAAPIIGVGLVLAAALAGVAVLRAYLLLFTGVRRETSESLAITPRERLAVLTLAGLILGGGLLPQPGVADRHAAAEALLSRRAEGAAARPADSAQQQDR